MGITLVDVHLNWLKWFLFLFLEGALLIILVDSMIAITIPRYCKYVYVNSFFLFAARLWNSQPLECFRITESHFEIENMQMRHHYQNTSVLSKYICEMKDKHNTAPHRMWYTVKSVLDYSNISKRCMLCLHEKYEILNYPDQEELQNKKSELLSKCQHVNKFLLSNYKSHD